MSSVDAIDQGAIAKIFTGAQPQEYKPVLEIRGFKALDGSRYSLHVADRMNVVRAVTFGQSGISDAIRQNQVSRGSLIRLHDYSIMSPNAKVQLLAIQHAEMVGALKQEDILADHQLQKFVNPHGGMSDVDASQAAFPSTQHLRQAPDAAATDAYTTPERRAASSAAFTTGMSEQTPPPNTAVSSRSSGVGVQGNGLNTKAGGCDIAEAETQIGYGQGVGNATAFASHPVLNPYAAQTQAVSDQHTGASSLHSRFESASVAGGNPHLRGSTAMQQQQQQQQKPPPAAASLQPMRGSSQQTAGQITPISTLSPYSGGRWRIKARVLIRGEIRRFSNARGEGQLLKVDLADQSGEIQATFFGKAVDKYYSLLKPGQVLTFQKGQIKAANKRFDRGDYVLIFEESSVIETVAEDHAIPAVTYDFKPLCAISELDNETHVDIKAVIYAVSEPFTFTAKTSQREMTKREIGLWDPSGPDGFTTQELTVWGDSALGDRYQVGTVVFLKRARVGEWNGAKSLSSPVQLDLNPDQPEAFDLQRRFQEHQMTSPITARASNRSSFNGSGTRQTLEACLEEDIHLTAPGSTQVGGPNDGRSIHRHNVMATFSLLDGNRGPFYPSCPAEVPSNRPAPSQGQAVQMRSCNKKVNQESDGSWHCQAGHTCQEPVFRYLFRLNILDHTGSMEVNVYDDVARKLMGCGAGEYVPIYEAGQAGGEQEARLKQINRRLEWKRCAMRLRAQKEFFQETERVRYSVDEAAAVPLAKEARSLLAEVQASLAAL
eukprot:TRINITY_DN2661_c0_g1_i2.p1 TRINITY_DN2661_c0_g1~~TRINITY_DN2661_c0_g1_i2.p1  ORF type:complete len:791 (+),score=137.13 TRINITY_DN2661_c0_g1_i2:57-2375(+)